MNNLIPHPVKNLTRVKAGLTIQTLPDIKEFITNKSDRFFVDFEDIIAGHPYVGKRSPTHNDASLFFKYRSKMERGFHLADGIIELAQGNGSYYNVVDHSDSELWHSVYLFKLKFAQNNGNVVSFLYQMEDM